MPEGRCVGEGYRPGHGRPGRHMPCAPPACLPSLTCNASLKGGRTGSCRLFEWLRQHPVRYSMLTSRRAEDHGAGGAAAAAGPPVVRACLAGHRLPASLLPLTCTGRQAGTCVITAHSKQ